MFKLHSNRKELWAGADAGEDGVYNQALLAEHTVPLWAAALQILPSSMDGPFSEYAKYFISKAAFYRQVYLARDEFALSFTAGFIILCFSSTNRYEDFCL